MTIDAATAALARRRSALTSAHVWRLARGRCRCRSRRHARPSSALGPWRESSISATAIGGRRTPIRAVALPQRPGCAWTKVRAALNTGEPGLVGPAFRPAGTSAVRRPRAADRRRRRAGFFTAIPAELAGPSTGQALGASKIDAATRGAAAQRNLAGVADTRRCTLRRGHCRPIGEPGADVVVGFRWRHRRRPAGWLDALEPIGGRAADRRWIWPDRARRGFTLRLPGAARCRRPTGAFRRPLSAFFHCAGARTRGRWGSPSAGTSTLHDAASQELRLRSAAPADAHDARRGRAGCSDGWCLSQRELR